MTRAELVHTIEHLTDDQLRNFARIRFGLRLRGSRRTMIATILETFDTTQEFLERSAS